MNQRLKNKALLTSPIIAIYGLTPIIFFNSINSIHLLVSFFSLTIGIYIFWLLNIYLIERKLLSIKRYIISYSFTFLLHTGTVFIITTSKEVFNTLNFLIYSVVATIAVNTIILVIINAEILRTKKELTDFENQKLKVVNLEAQKKVLIQQLHPHFLFNALSTLKSLIKENQEQAEDYSIKLSEFLRYSIHVHENELVPLKEELRFTIDYIDLQKVRFGDSLICNVEISEELMKFKLPAFALQTLIENAIKHNLFNCNNPLIITILLDGTKLKITNNKNPKPIIQIMGTGLKNLDERYKIISGTGIKIIEEDNYFTVYLNLISA